MTGIVVVNRPELEYAQHVGTPVRARDWYAAAGLANWIRGRGACLVPMTSIGAQIAAGASANFNFYTKNRGSCIERVWIVTGYAVTTGRSAILILGDGTATQQFTLGDRFSAPAMSVFHVKQIASRSTARAELRLVVDNTSLSTSAVVISGIACYEQDRPILQDDTTEGGVELYSCSTKQPIFQDDYRSLDAVERVMLSAGDARRVGMFHWTRGSASEVVNDEATAKTILTLGAPVLARKIGTSDTTNPNIYWSAKCRVTGPAATGRITLTHTNNAGTFTDTVDYTNTTSSWLTPRNITNFDCEDLAAADGRRASAWDLVNFNFRLIAADEFRAAFVESISIWEE
jgi:hypothetical protein